MSGAQLPINKDIQFCRPYIILFVKFNLQFGLLQLAVDMMEPILVNIPLKIIFTSCQPLYRIVGQRVSCGSKNLWAGQQQAATFVQWPDRRANNLIPQISLAFVFPFALL